MNFYYSTHTTHRPQTNSSHFNEDARCDNEVNLILEKNYNQQLIEQSVQKEQQQSAVVSQTDQYYFVPIREQSSTMALPANTNSNVADSSSQLLADLTTPSTENPFDYSTTVTKFNDSYNLTDADLAALFVSSIVSTTPSNINDEQKSEHSNNKNNNNNTLDDVFIQQVNDLVCSAQPKPLGPPPGFENFRFDTSSSSSDNSINNAALQTSQVSSSDTINFSQLLPTNIIDPPQQQHLIGSNVRSSSSSHSSFTSDEQSIFYPMSTHHYSSSSSSQIYSTNTPSSSTITNSNAKPFLPSSLSTTNQTFSSLDASNHHSISPIATKFIDAEQMRTDADATPNHLFTSPNSFFSNGHKDFAPTKPSTTKLSSTNRQSSSSASSSTSSSIDDALIQLSQQQQQQQPSANKFFANESLSIFNFPSTQSTTTTTTNIDKQQRAVHDNISFLASMAAASTPVTPESPWQQAPIHHSQRKTQSMMLQQQPILPQSPSINMQELIENLNEICYRGFDELNALIQEQRWVQNYLNVNSSSPSSPLVNINGANCCSSRILIVPEYFIFKCKKIEINASHVYELLATGRPELRLRDLMFVFKSWKDSITNAELIHQEEETKIRSTTDHRHSYYINENHLQAAFDRMFNTIRQLGTMTQQARAAFQYATLNVFQMSSRQQNQLSSNLSQSSHAMQQQKSSSSSIHRLGSSIHTTP